LGTFKTKAAAQKHERAFSILSGISFARFSNLLRYKDGRAVFSAIDLSLDLDDALCSTTIGIAPDETIPAYP